jgi:hypothetical protein
VRCDLRTRGHGCTGPDTDADGDEYTDPHVHPNTHADPHKHGYADVDAHAYSDANHDTHAYSSVSGGMLLLFPWE